MQLEGPVLALTVPDYDTVGTSVPDSAFSATLSGSGGAAGTMDFFVVGPTTTAPSCSGGTAEGTAAVTGDGTYNPNLATGFSPTGAGEYWWYASFTDTANDPTIYSACGSDEMTAGQSVPTLTITSPTNATLGQAVNITATLSGSGTGSTGTISFSEIGPTGTAPTSCSGGGVVGTATVTGDGTYNPGPIHSHGHGRLLVVRVLRRGRK